MRAETQATVDSIRQSLALPMGERPTLGQAASMIDAALLGNGI